MNEGTRIRVWLKATQGIDSTGIGNLLATRSGEDLRQYFCIISSSNLAKGGDGSFYSQTGKQKRDFW